MKNILVQDIMTRYPVKVKPDTNLLECAKQMIKNRVRSLPIVDKKKLLGFISQRDILWAIVKKSQKDISKIKVIEISPRKITTLKPIASIEEAIEKMKKTKFERLPVVKDNELIGIITMQDILNFHPEIYPELKEIKTIREQEEKLKRVQMAKNRAYMHEGICEECGDIDILYKVDGRVVCESCRNSM